MIIALADITADQRAQPRTSIMVERVGEYTEDMQRGDKFPPLIVFREGEKFWLADGFHRYYAAVAAELDKVECYVKDGTLRDAILYSCAANAAHGLRRTYDDKRRAVAKMLEDDEWKLWADREIAEHCSVSHVLVGKVRKEVAAFSLETVSSERRYRTRHGTVATMQLAPREGAKLEDGEVIAKWLSEIERTIGRMPQAREAVAMFPADQHYLFPLSRLEEMAAWMADFADAWRAKMEEKVHESA